eukprot:TRINITY_DN1858_c1_g1_i1.p1 TRINITY_DN1858_c1_g1~~TRINITY_DN1858_c1_g1_i1.p1  ORF type:complete len:1115 (+),score=341.81 TRINITY_DN1858_c1_g1_i1:69-3413(+)
MNGSGLEVVVDRWRRGRSPRQRRINQQTIGSDPLLGLFPFLERVSKRMSLPVVFPETVVYEHHFPRGWYWCEVPGAGRGRQQRQLLDESDPQNASATPADTDRAPLLHTVPVRECETRAILESFTAGRGRSQGYLAQVVRRPEGDDGRQEGLSVQLLDYEGLKRFLMKLPDQCILSKYIPPPKSAPDEVLQTTWTSESVRVARFRQTPGKVDGDGGAQVLCPPGMQRVCVDAVRQLVAVIEDQEKQRVIEFECTFKLDRPQRSKKQRGSVRGRLWLLWVSRLWLIRPPNVVEVLQPAKTGRKTGDVGELAGRAVSDPAALEYLGLSPLQNQPAHTEQAKRRGPRDQRGPQPAAPRRSVMEPQSVQLQPQQHSIPVSPASFLSSVPHVQSLAGHPGRSGSREGTPTAEDVGIFAPFIVSGLDVGAEDQEQEHTQEHRVHAHANAQTRRRRSGCTFPITRIGVRMPPPVRPPGGWPTFCTPEPPDEEAADAAKRYFEDAIRAEMVKAARRRRVRQGTDRLKMRAAQLRKTVAARAGSPPGATAAGAAKRSARATLLQRRPSSRYSRNNLVVQADFPPEPYIFDESMVTALPLGTPFPSPVRRGEVAALAEVEGAKTPTGLPAGAGGADSLEWLAELVRDSVTVQPRTLCPPRGRPPGPSRCHRVPWERRSGRSYTPTVGSDPEAVSYLALAKQLGVQLSLQQETSAETEPPSPSPRSMSGPVGIEPNSPSPSPSRRSSMSPRRRIQAAASPATSPRSPDAADGREREKQELITLLTSRRRLEYERMCAQHRDVRDALQDVEYSAYSSALDRQGCQGFLFCFDLPTECPRPSSLADLNLERARLIPEVVAEQTKSGGMCPEFCLRVRWGEPPLLVIRQTMLALRDKLNALMRRNEVSLLLRDLDVATIRCLKYHKLPQTARQQNNNRLSMMLSPGVTGLKRVSRPSVVRSPGATSQTGADFKGVSSAALTPDHRATSPGKFVSDLLRSRDSISPKGLLSPSTPRGGTPVVGPAGLQTLRNILEDRESRRSRHALPDRPIVNVHRSATAAPPPPPADPEAMDEFTVSLQNLTIKEAFEDDSEKDDDDDYDYDELFQEGADAAAPKADTQPRRLAGIGS